MCDEMYKLMKKIFERECERAFKDYKEFFQYLNELELDIIIKKDDVKDFFNNYKKELNNNVKSKRLSNLLNDSQLNMLDYHIVREFYIFDIDVKEILIKNEQKTRFLYQRRGLWVIHE